ncbi:hypothetical protein Tco_0314555, partial [Tanacetum coccineum]
HSSTNDDNIANVHGSTGSSLVSTASTNNSTACLSDATVNAYLATQPNGSQVVHKDLETGKKIVISWDILLESAEILRVKRTGAEVKTAQGEQ